MMTNTNMKPITHLEHPEDLILGGETWVLDALSDCGGWVSQKIDGAPAIVWGTDPNNGKFFVGTKSVFNKKKIKICYTELDILTYYQGDKYISLVYVLCQCLKYLPRTEGVFQGDFIGHGGSNIYKPNTLVYKFPQVVKEDIIVAPHTYYEGNIFPEMVPYPLTDDLVSTKNCKFVQPIVDRIAVNIEPVVINKDEYSFLDKKQLAQAKQSINGLIREGVELTDEVLFDVLGDNHLVNIFQLVVSLKEQFMEGCITYLAPEAYLNWEPCDGEGYVYSSPLGSFKLIDRPVFAHVNMTQGRFSK